jgi:hypothetical protein
MRGWYMNDRLEGMWKEAIVVQFMASPGIWLEGLRKTTKIISQDSRSPGRDLNKVPSEYEAVVLATRPWG